MRGRWAIAVLGLIVASCEDGASPVDGTPRGAEDPPPQARDDARDRPVRRLSNAELSSALAALFGMRRPDEDRALGHGAWVTERFEYPPDATLHNFDNNAEMLPVSPEFLARHLVAVEALTDEALAAPRSAMDLVRCEVPATDACVDAFARRFASAAFRRPLSPSEDARLSALARAGERRGHAFARDLVLEVLMAPQFLFHMATGPRAGASQRLSGYDLADRLAFTLWGAAPDWALLDDARRGALDTAEGVGAAADRMLADARAEEGTRRFIERWFRVDHLREATLATQQRHPELNGGESLKGAYHASFLRGVEEVLAPGGGDMLALLDTRVAWIDAQTRFVFGAGPLGAPVPSGLARVELPASSQRAGILTHPAVLVLGTNASGEVSPVRRGLYVRQTLLCEDIPPPPPGVSAIPLGGDDPGADRASFTAHRADPSCVACHVRLEPLGFGFEAFDNLGMLLPSNAARGAGELVDVGPRSTFEGPQDLATLLRAAPEVRRCMVRQYLRYALARTETDADTPTVAAVDAAFTAGGRTFASLVRATVRSDAFRTAAGGAR